MSVALLFYLTLSTYKFPAQAPSEEEWYELNAKNFFELAEANQAVDLNNPHYALLNAAIFHATNQARQREGLSKLEFDPTLLKAAEYHSESMRKDDFFGHINKGRSNLRTPSDRVQNFKGQFKSVGENIAQVTPLKLGEDRKFFRNESGNLVNQQGKRLENKTYAELAQNVVASWMDSPGHRQNILGQYSHLGCGASQIFTEEKRQVPEIILTQNFGLK